MVTLRISPPSSISTSASSRDSETPIFQASRAPCHVLQDYRHAVEGRGQLPNSSRVFTGTRAIIAPHDSSYSFRETDERSSHAAGDKDPAIPETRSAIALSMIRTFQAAVRFGVQ